MTKTLAIGGHAHGMALPLPAHGYRLHTMAPVQFDFADLAAEIPVAMPETVAYNLQEYAVPGRQPQRFKVYVVEGMPLAEAEPWLQLVLTWTRFATRLILGPPQRLMVKEWDLPWRLVYSGYLDRLDERRRRRAWAARDELVAAIWYCGDDYCDCTQPVIERITPNHRAGYPWIRRDRVWEGRFLTDTWGYTSEDLEAMQYGPLREACQQYGIEPPA